LGASDPRWEDVDGRATPGHDDGKIAGRVITA
jgi:hypothetical protein